MFRDGIGIDMLVKTLKVANKHLDQSSIVSQERKLLEDRIGICEQIGTLTPIMMT